MAKRLLPRTTTVSSGPGRIVDVRDEGRTSSLITRAIEKAPFVNNAFLVTFKDQAGHNQHHPIKAMHVEEQKLREEIVGLMRQGLVLV